MKMVGKAISFLVNLYIVGYAIYLTFKSEPTLKEIMGVVCLSLVVNIITEDKVCDIKEALKELKK